MCLRELCLDCHYSRQCLCASHLLKDASLPCPPACTQMLTSIGQGTVTAPDTCAAFLQVDSSITVAAQPVVVRVPLLLCGVKGKASGQGTRFKCQSHPVSCYDAERGFRADAHWAQYSRPAGQSMDMLASCEVLSCLGRLCCCAGSGRYMAGRYMAGRSGRAGWPKRTVPAAIQG